MHETTLFSFWQMHETTLNLLSHTQMDVMFFGHNIWMDVQVDHQAAAAEGIW